MLTTLVTTVRRITMSVTKPEVIFVLGGPGSGKGTLCSKIENKFGYVHLSAGDLLRKERSDPQSQYGTLIESHIVNGTIVPVEITCNLLVRAMEIHKNSPQKFLIDGFPRNDDNIQGWDRVVGDKVLLKAVIFLECDKDVCTERCLNRGARGSNRTDDNIESLTKRHQTYMNDSLPIIKLLEQKNLVHVFDGMKSPDEIFSDVCDMFKTIGWN